MTGLEGDDPSEVEGTGAVPPADEARGAATNGPSGSPPPPSSPTTATPSPLSTSSPARPGVGTFTIEGRRAPALFVVGWLATLVGGGLIFVGLFSGGRAAAPLLILGGLALLGLGLVAGAGSQAIERRARGERGYQGPSPFLVLAAAIPLTVLLQALVGIPLRWLGVDTTTPYVALLGLLLTVAVYLGLVRFLVVGTESLSWAEMGVRWPGRSGVLELSYGAMLGVPFVFLSGLLALLLSQFLSVPEGTLPAPDGFAGGLVNLVTAAIVAPIAEEIFFRGFSTTAWWRAIGPNRAIVRGALFFAAAHVLTIGGDTFGEGIEHAFFAFLVRIPVALALGWVFVRRRSLVAAIGLHATYNGLPVLILLLGGG